MHQYKRSHKPNKPQIPKLLYLVLAIILLLSSAVIVNYITESFRIAHGIYAMANSPLDYYPPFTPPPTPPPTPTPVPTPTPEVVIEPTPTPEPTPDPTPSPPPRVPRQEFLDYRAHYGNDDIIGHVYIPNTTVNYLVVQGTDNEFYLYHDIRGRRFLPGWIYLDYMVDLRGQDQNMVLYGHNMRVNHKFHMVRHFINHDFFFNHRYIYFSTIYADYVFEVFSAYVTDINFIYTWPNYEDWAAWIQMFADRSWFDAGIEVSEEDRILTLSTCHTNPVFRDYRIVVHARLISETFPHLEGELSGVPETDVTYNYE